MPDLNFRVLTAESVPYSVGPLLKFKLQVSQAAGAGVVPIHSVTLQCQIRIDPAKRHYANAEQEKLLDLFDRPSRWGQTLKPMLWTHTSAGIGPFTESIAVDLPVPCTYDFNLAVTKYFYALVEGEIPVNLLFSGTVFYEGEDGQLQVAQIPWDREAAFRLPIAVWKEMMEHYYPNCSWLCLRKDVFDRLYEYKSRRGLSSWEQALERLLSAAEDDSLSSSMLGRAGEKPTS